MDPIKLCFKSKITTPKDRIYIPVSSRQCFNAHDIARLKNPNLGPQTYQLPRISNEVQIISLQKTARKTVFDEEIQKQNIVTSPAYYSPQISRNIKSQRQYITDRTDSMQVGITGMQKQYNFKYIPLVITQNTPTIKFYKTQRFQPLNPQRENVFLGPGLYDLRK
uniref:Uncharacterized protein n=1 Tax=Spironucleus salmonicida TaxID=348837 RepID=V6LCP8_9EUKA|eukprot:EST42028.1 hypothetical protein SS50377_18335 [Spironucleus salmonicida]